MRWNAVAMVQQANKVSSEYGGHLASYASSATLYEVGFNHFWRARFGRSIPATWCSCRATARPACMRAPTSKAACPKRSSSSFRQEVGGGGLSSYPHPWLMPDFWQFPTVSMGLGPMMAIYQARFHALHGEPRPGAAHPTARSGASAATARWTSRSRWAR